MEDGRPSLCYVVVLALLSLSWIVTALISIAMQYVRTSVVGATVPDGVTYVECNVGDKAAVDAAIDTCAATGRIDVLANVAGIVQFGRFEQISEAEYDRVQAVDLKGPFFLIQAALPHIRAAKGNIVNVSSVAGNKPQGYSAAYSAAKGGLTQLTQALALELAPEGIRVNAVCPGTVDTPLVQHVAENFPTLKFQLK